jgi:hypothetical protein
MITLNEICAEGRGIWQILPIIFAKKLAFNVLEYLFKKKSSALGEGKSLMGNQPNLPAANSQYIFD